MLRASPPLCCATARLAAEDPLDSRLQASFLSCVTTVRAMSAALAQKDGPAHDAALNLAVAQQRGEAPPPTGQVALQIHEASRAAWASHVQWERIRRASCGDDAFHPHDDQERIVNSHGLRCCPRCEELRHQRPLRVGFVLDNATCWCYGPCQRPWSGPCTAGCEGPCECEASLEAGQTVWYCDSWLHLLRARRGLHRVLEMHGIRRRSLWTYGPSYGT